MTRKIKSIICLMAICVCMLGTTLVAHADTSNFTLTVTRNGTNEDNMSKRTLKDGGSSYENKFYCTSTSYAGTTGTISVKSVKLYDTDVESNSINFGTAALKSANANYKSYARSGDYYYLKGRFVASTGSTVKMLGRYTP